MATLLSNGPLAIANSIIPEKYVLPQERRPAASGKVHLPKVDLSDEENSLTQILKAIQDFGLFQVVNHGISKEQMDKAMKVYQGVFELTPEEKAAINLKEDKDRICEMFTSSYNFQTEQFHYWRDAMRHHCYPLDECTKFWPTKPENYKEVIGAHVTQMRELGARILQKISEGLGLEKDYFEGKLSQDNIVTVHHYPLCPDPSLTIGLPKHIDPTLVNLAHVSPVDVPGLQLIRDGKWVDVVMEPDAFVLFVGSQLEVVSNGKMKAAVHRVVTNSEKPRTAIDFFISPAKECVVEPAKAIVEADQGRPLFKASKFQDYFETHTGHDGETDGILETHDFMIKS